MSSRDSSPTQIEPSSVEDGGAILEQNRDDLLLYIEGKLGSEGQGLAGDIWQEVAIAVHRHDFEARPVKDPLSWLRGIASHKIADHWRTASRGRKADTRWMEQGGGSPLRSPFDWVLLQSRRETIQGVLERLSEEDRRILREKYFVGHTVAEMAHKEGVGEKVIEHRLARARTSFREMLASES